MKKMFVSVIILFLVVFQMIPAFAAQRFPKPEFESGYTQPDTLTPSARAEILAVMDVAVLLITLSVISWLVIKKRSRKGVFWVSLFSPCLFWLLQGGLRLLYWLNTECDTCII
jgi:NosR/NirI family nitrous oxide reductase transcriptional regulator